MSESDHPQLHFIQKVRESFSFLVDGGFAETEASPTVVRYRNGDIEVGVYHEPRRYELEADIAVTGIRYALSEIMRASDPDAISYYPITTTTKPEVIAAAIEKLGVLMQRYGMAALRSGPHFFSMIDEQRKQGKEKFALDVLERQLRPQAEEAFRRKDYSKAAELYGRIRERLSPAEAKKLALAEARKY